MSLNNLLELSFNERLYWALVLLPIKDLYKISSLQKLFSMTSVLKLILSFFVLRKPTNVFFSWQDVTIDDLWSPSVCWRSVKVYRSSVYGNFLEKKIQTLKSSTNTRSYRIPFLGLISVEDVSRRYFKDRFSWEDHLKCICLQQILKRIPDYIWPFLTLKRSFVWDTSLKCCPI